jgi:uncharacterized protein (DUF983 family)
MAQSRLGAGLKRGWTGRCPQCGQGRLLRAYLKVVSPCPACGHDNGQYPADDAPPYFTILIIGHVVVAPVLCLSFIWTLPAGWVLAVTLPAILAATLLLLPRVKGAVIGAQWAIKRKEREASAAAWSPPDVEV